MRRNKDFPDIETARRILDEECEKLPGEVFRELNGGVNLQPDVRRSPDGLYTMGLYHNDVMGRWIEIFYGSMRAVQQASLYPGNNSAEIDAWIFDPSRKSGDKILIEGEKQMLILFYVEASPNPEWYDRVNSFIRMDNYQAFVSEKLKDYAYVFHEDGLKYIEDIPS